MNAPPAGAAAQPALGADRAAGARAPLSIVIPCWNDDAALRSIVETARDLRGVREIIVADASTNDVCAAVAQALGAKVVRCACPNRGAQMNAGARTAGGELLLFQHADTELTQTHVDALLSAMRDPDVIGGAFHRKFDDRHPRLAFLEPWSRVLAQLGGTLFGDQSIFIRRSAFTRLGGFAEIPLMEDVDFSRRLRHAGRRVVLDPPIASSARHHRRLGPWRASLRNGLMIALYRLGVSPESLHAWYYRGDVPE